MTDDYAVPESAVTYECRYCGRPFAREEWLALHRGLDHPAQLDDGEIAAFRAAHEREESELGHFRLRALGALVLIYFCLLMIYALV
ncbi:DUF7410 domain-containing protein [Haloarcula sediminis]|uniref:DUF7410 domain-containing protein n=1 Tax=Haloarcula sediminis TaxID=3111777 RepID=UPI002D79AFFD|nr:C2H2-type zinc finger protein [Haloarcula sp. CK38]